MPPRAMLASALLSALVVTATASRARADVVPVEPPQECGEATTREPCTGKKPGDACTLTGGAAGSCVALRCTNDAGETMLACNTSGSSTKGADDGGCTASGGASGPLLALVAMGSLAALALVRRTTRAR